MKKNGIWNKPLSDAIASLGHTDKIVICDCGFPVPADANLIDLAIVRGEPKFSLVFKAVLSELVVEKYTIFKRCEELNPATYKLITETLTAQECTKLMMPEFQEAAKGAKAYVRVGDDAPCSNIILQSASGTVAQVAKYNIDVEL